jgi:cyclopropane-fatty-acyl-phospholipid synthase
LTRAAALRILPPGGGASSGLIMRRVLDGILRRMIAHGRLEVRWPDGSASLYGAEASPAAALAITDGATLRRLVFDPSLALGEAYMDGTVQPLGCAIYDVLDVLTANMGGAAHPVLRARERVGRWLRRAAQSNPAPRARRNAAHHYDLNKRLYSLFLDRDRQYSCGYFPTGGETLEAAQEAKKRHIAAKLLLDRSDLRVLDIGSGWGGLALTLARDYGARVLGITLSSEQLAESRARAEAEGLSDRVSFELLDYRAVDEPFDRIVSVGMFEHVGVGHYDAFFRVVQRCLAHDGVALLHTIGRSDGPASTNRWLAKYIFPGGYSPALSEVVPPVERAGLIVTDVEILRLHYAQTLRHWRRRFAANRDAISALYDERFCRMFEFYLAGSELAFRRMGHVNFQIQLVRDQTALPFTRDYIMEQERRTAALPQHA